MLRVVRSVDGKTVAEDLKVKQEYSMRASALRRWIILGLLSVSVMLWAVLLLSRLHVINVFAASLLKTAGPARCEPHSGIPRPASLSFAPAERSSYAGNWPSPNLL